MMDGGTFDLDSLMTQAKLGKLPSESSAGTPPSIPDHPAPDGSGATTNLSDADYYTMTGKSGGAALPQVNLPQINTGGDPAKAQGSSGSGILALPAPGSPVSPPSAAIDVSGARPETAMPQPFDIDNLMTLGIHGKLPPPSSQSVQAPQMTGISRQLALPASGVAAGLVQAAGFPGDVFKGLANATGQSTKYASRMGLPMANPDGLPVPPLSEADQPGQSGLAPLMGGQGSVPIGPSVEPWSGHNPLDTQSLMGLTNAAGITNRPDLQPQNNLEKYESAGAQGIGMVVPTALTGGVSTIPNALRLMRQGIGMGVGSEAGGDLGQAVGGTPGRVIGSLAGGVAPGGVAALSRMAAPTVTPLVQSALPILNSTRQDLAARSFASANTPEVRVALANPTEHVPGSPATSYQVTGNSDLGAAEKAVANQAQYKGAFSNLADLQNEKRVAAIQGQSPAGADTSEIAPWFRDKLQRMRDVEGLSVGGNRTATKGAVDALGNPTTAHEAGAAVKTANAERRAPEVAASDAALSGAQARAGQAVEQMGGAVPSSPEERTNAVQLFGRRSRADLDQRNEAARVATSRLYDAVDPDGELVVDMSGIKKAARDIAKDIPKNAAKLEGDAGAILGVAQMQPKAQLFKEVGALRSRITDAMRTELSDNGRSQTYRRLSQLLGAVDDTLTHGVESAVEADAGAADRLASMMREEPDGSVAGQGSGRGVAEGEPQGPGSVRGSGGTEGEGSERPGTGRGNSAVETASADGELPGNLTDLERSIYGDLIPKPEPESNLTPNFDPDAAARYRAANASHATRVATYDEAPGIGPVLESGSRKGEWKLGDALVPSRLFQRGAAGAEVGDALIKAAGSPDAAIKILGDYPAYSLRQEAEKMGALSVKDYEKWAGPKGFGPILDKFPELKNRFDTAAKASAVLDDLKQERAAIDAANPIDPGWGDAQTIEKFVQRGPKGYEGAAKLVDAIGDSPTARDATRDYLASSLRDAAEIKTGPNAGTLDDPSYKRWMKDYGGFLSHPSMADARTAFEDAGRAQQSLDAAAAAHREAQNVYLKSVARHFLPDDVDPVEAIGKILGSDMANSQMADLARQTANDPMARKAIQAAVIKNMLKRVSSTNARGEDLDAINLRNNEVQKFVARSAGPDGPLRHVMEPDQLKAINAVATDIRQSNRAIGGGRNTEGSMTAFNTSARENDSHSGSPATIIGGMEVAGHIGERLLDTQWGRVIGAIMVPLLQAARRAGFQTVNDIRAAALLNPSKMSALLARLPTEAELPSRIAAIRAQLAAIGALSVAHGANDNQSNQPRSAAK